MRLVEAFITKMENNPEQFVAGKYTITHTPSSTKVWLGNGLLFYGGYEPSVRFTFFEKLSFRTALSRWSAWKVMKDK